MPEAGLVVVVGSINVDLVATADRLPQAGETVLAGAFTRNGGGKGANQAVAAVRAGAATRLVGCVGEDAEGRTAIAELDDLGVDVGLVIRTAAAATGVALIVVDAAGDNQIAVAPGANLLVEAFSEKALAGGPGVLLLSFEVGDAVLCDAAEAALAAGWLIVVNPAPARPLPERLRACHPILIPNEHEATLLTGIDDPAQAALALTEQTHAAVIVSLGADGALVADDAGISVFSAVAVDVVDTTGAGDCLCGTFAARLAAGHDLSAALCDALEAATASTRLPGAR